MTEHPLLTDDLVLLLQQFPNPALFNIVSILKEHKSWSPLPASRAYEAHETTSNDQLLPHVPAIAQEIFWWGSNDVDHQFGKLRDWCAIVTDTARQIGVPSKELAGSPPAWHVERALLRTALAEWEKLSPEIREDALRRTGGAREAAKGGPLLATGSLVSAGSAQIATFLAARGASYAAAATVLAPLAIVLGAVGAVWAAYDLAGPAFRVLRPLALTIAYSRNRLCDGRAAAAFED